MKPVTECDANCINAAGYWMMMNESAIGLRLEEIDDEKNDEVLRCDL